MTIANKNQEKYSRVSIYLKVTYNLLQLGINKYITWPTPLIPALTTLISKLKALFTWKVTAMAIYGPCLNSVKNASLLKGKNHLDVIKVDLHLFYRNSFLLGQK